MNLKKGILKAWEKDAQNYKLHHPVTISALFEMHIIAYFFARAAVNHLPEGNDWIEC